MNCFNCNNEMIFGKFDLQRKYIEYLFKGNIKHLYFDAYDSRKKEIKLMDYNEHKKGFYCKNCGYVIIKEESRNISCIKCNSTMHNGDFLIKQPRFLSFFRDAPSNLYFTFGQEYKPIEIIDSDEYVRGFYCENCGIACFNSLENKAYQLQN